MAGSNDIAIKYLQGLLAELRKQSAHGIAEKSRMPPPGIEAAGEEGVPELAEEDLAALAELPDEMPPEEDDENLKLR